MKKSLMFLLFACSSFLYSQCNILYVSPTGTGAGTTASPASLANALTIATSGTIIRLSIGTFTLNNPITLATDGITIEGGFDPAQSWRKTSLAGATVILRSALNPEGAANQQRLVAIYANGRTNFRFQDLTIQTANGTGNGMSTYGIHLTNCSNYNIVRTQVLPGNASAGNAGAPGAAGTAGAAGGFGASGSCDGGSCTFSSGNAGGAGGNGGTGAVGVVGGSGGPAVNSAQNNGSSGSSGTLRNGGGGGGGGAGGDECASNNAGTSGNGGASACVAGGTGGARGGDGNPGGDGANGTNGAAGTSGITGAAGASGTHTGGFWVPGAQGGTGGDGCGGSGGGGGGGGGRQTCAFCDNGPGNGGSGGGGGGQGGAGATGGLGGGSSYGIYLFTNGVIGLIDDCRIVAGAAGAGGAGGSGGAGGAGGAGAARNTTCTSEIGEGGAGGNGGAGGAGGAGGVGSAGQSINVHLQSGTALSLNDNAFNLPGQPVIFMQNINCTYQNITFSSGASALWNFAGCSSPSGPTGASVITQYTCTGRNDVGFNANTYTGFAYIGCARSTSTISPVACATYTSPSGLATYSSSGTYTDVITNSQGCDSVITINLTILGATTLIWNAGAATTAWGTAANWNSCGTPVCAVDAIVNPAAQQPVLPAGTYSVKNLTINAGATLTVQNGATLQICGDLTNNGNLICQTGSTVEFIGTGLQTISGNFPTNPFYHFTVTKSTGSVIINNDIVVNGNFTTTSNTSVFNNNNRNIQLFGNFNNANGNTTFTNTGTTGGLYFAGANSQTYNQGISQLDLNWVNVNKTANGVTLNTNMYVKPTTGELQLLNGMVTTGGFHIEVANTATNSVNGASAASYVNGNLWRSVLAAGGSYDFPVGNSLLYEKANINIQGANTYTQLQARFDIWPSGPNTLGLSECSTTYSMPSEDHGYWTINQTGGNTGNYNATLYCTGATNTAGVSGWTVEKASSIAGPWGLSGTCDMTSTAAVVKRTNMSGFSVFAAAQSSIPLPIELLSFSGNSEGLINHLYWSTSSEVNNDFFVLEKSVDGINYEPLSEIDGAGNSNTLHNYDAIDERPAKITYYRLKQYDFNGNSETFGPIVIENVNLSGFSFISIFPNPAADLFYIKLSSSETTEVNYFISDAVGKQIYAGVAIVDGNSQLDVKCSNWSPGIYFVRICSPANNFDHTEKVIIR